MSEGDASKVQEALEDALAGAPRRARLQPKRHANRRDLGRGSALALAACFTPSSLMVSGWPCAQAELEALRDAARPGFKRLATTAMGQLQEGIDAGARAAAEHDAEVHRQAEAEARRLKAAETGGGTSTPEDVEAHAIAEEHEYEADAEAVAVTGSNC